MNTMTIEEHISGEIQHFVPGGNGEPGSWVTYGNGILSDANVISASVKRQCCEDGQFTIGGVFAATIQLVCRLPGMTRYQLRGARIVLRSQYAGEAEPVPIGTFWATHITRVRDIFTIRGMDAMGWTDVTVPIITEQTGGGGYWAYDIFSDDPWKLRYYEIPVVETTVSFARTVLRVDNPEESWIPNLSTWCIRFFMALNPVLQEKTGISDLAAYRPYSSGNNCGIWGGNHYVFSNFWAKETNPESEDPIFAYFGLYQDDGVFKSEKPRDLLRWIAECTGGFFTVERDGRFTLRQFCMPELGIAEIYDADTEADSLEISDYYIYPNWIDIKSGNDYFSIRDGYTDSVSGGFQIRITENPVLSGFNHPEKKSSVAYGLYYAFVQYEDVNCVNGENVLVSNEAGKHIGLYKAYPVPFRAKVHKPQHFELGQTIVFPDHPNTINNYRYGRTDHVPYLRSVITSIEWTFRGGQVIACGEGDVNEKMEHH